MSTEDAIESLLSKLKEARHLTDEASTKHDEVTYKLDRLGAGLNRNTDRAEKAEKRVAQLESELGKESSSLSNKVLQDAP
jgi:chromosome segregation ATPase